jgi:hypothetical protein
VRSSPSSAGPQTASRSASVQLQTPEKLRETVMSMRFFSPENRLILLSFDAPVKNTKGAQGRHLTDPAQ